MYCSNGEAQDDNIFRLIPAANNKYKLYATTVKKYCIGQQSNVFCKNDDSGQEEELFEKVDLGDNKVTFKCSNEKFMAREGANEIIKCTAASVNDAEMFKLTTVDSSKQEPEKPKDPPKQEEPEKIPGKHLISFH